MLLSTQIRRGLVMLTVVGTAAVAIPALNATPAHASDCSGTTYTWTGNDDGHTWGDAKNWSPSTGSPQSTDSATIEANGSTGAIGIDGAGSVCDLTIVASDPSNRVQVNTSGDINVSGNLSVTGGSSLDDNGAFLKGGSITVSGTTTIAGSVEYLTSADFPTTITTLDTQSLLIDDGADLALGDGSNVIKADSLATIGAARIRSIGSSSSDSIGKLEIAGQGLLTGNVDAELDVQLLPAAHLDLAGSDLDVSAPSYSLWSNGSSVDSSAGSGTVTFHDGTWLMLDGSVTDGTGATVRLVDQARLSDAANYPGEAALPGGAGELDGPGTFDWQSGTLQGTLVLGPTLQTVADGGFTTRSVQQNLDDSLITNKGSFTVFDGTVHLPSAAGEFVNDGTMVIDQGATFDGDSNEDPPPFVNAASGTLAIRQNPISPTAMPAVVTANLDNLGTIQVPKNLVLSFQDGRNGLIDGGSTLVGGGTVRIDSSLVHVHGTVALRTGTVLQIDGDGADLVGGNQDVNNVWHSGVLTASAGSGGGALAFGQGRIDGHFATTGAVRTVMYDDGTHPPLDLGGAAAYDPASISLGSPTTVASQIVHINQAAHIDLSSSLTLKGANPQFGTGYGNPSVGGDIVIARTGSLIGASAAATVDYPLFNHGTVDVASGTLALPSGYLQPSGGTPDTSVARRAVLDLAGQPATFAAGFIQGSGTILGNVTNTAATVLPGGSGIGVLTIKGSYFQGSHATMKATVKGASASKHDRLAVSGAAVLGGVLRVVVAKTLALNKAVAVLTGHDVSKAFAHLVASGQPKRTKVTMKTSHSAVTVTLKKKKR